MGNAYAATLTLTLNDAKHRGLPFATGTPQLMARARAVVLSPKMPMTSGAGPQNVICRVRVKVRVRPMISGAGPPNAICRYQC